MTKMKVNVANGLDRLRLFKKLEEGQKQAIRDTFNKITPLLAKICKAFDWYTPHGISHSLTVISHLDILLEPIIKKLDSEQIFALMIAAAVHDIGMVPNLFDEDQDIELSEDRIQELRRTHHLRSERYVKEILNVNYMNESIRHSVGLLVKGHRVVELFTKEYNDPSSIVKNLSFLSAALRLADELDLSYERVSFLDSLKDPQKLLDRIPEESVKFWKGHLTIEDWTPSMYREGIILHASIKDLEGLFALELVKQKLTETLDEICFINLEEFRFPNRVECRNTSSTLVDIPLEVSMDSEVLDTLVGAMYSRKTIAIRELIQNAIDACILQ
ncbi:MAG: hypothetical protein E3J86_11685 [Candidatus Thorarchaeota archaeon]|nr:MAG: hypothetical protein E3J86_11685 [Candidatus Thorarchaeota archaeon]